MSTPFLNFLSGSPTSSGTNRTYKSYAHASNFYTFGKDLSKLPKVGFIYFVSFNLNPAIGARLPDHVKKDLGFLAKKVDLPKFKVSTQTINQYNRKTNIQTKLTYEPINIEFHDDNSEISSALWRLYYNYYYAEGKQPDGEFSESYKGNSKYSELPAYGFGFDSMNQDPFFESVDIYVLHQGNFSQYSISNPLITQWDHDTLDQANGQKLLQNKMGLSYDSVVYSQGIIKQNETVANAFDAVWYDKDANLPMGYSDPLHSPIKPIIPQYPTPNPPGLSESQLDKLNMGRIPVTIPPRPLGAGTFGLSSFRPPKPFSIDVWYGYGGLHGRGIINAGPIRLVLKK